jgi:gliding motility-associated lipoprotein GldH
MKKILSLLLTVILFSCQNQSHQSSNKVVFDNQTWQRFSNLEFNIPVQPQDTMDFDLILVYDSKDFKLKSFPINVTLYTPNNEIRSRDYVMRLYNYQTKQYLGEKKGDLVTFKLPLRRGTAFPKAGNLKVVIENKNPKIETKGVVSVELAVTHQD